MTTAEPPAAADSPLAALRDRIERALNTTLGPLLHGRRLKLWLSAELPTLPAGNWLALTGPGLQRALEHGGHVPPQPGAVAVLFSVPLILAEANHDPETAAALLGSIAAHEAAHALEHLHLDPSDADAETCRTILARVADLPDDPQPWHGHGPDWIRAAHHIADRLRRSGFAAPASQVFFGETLGLSPAGYYWGAAGLLAESERFAQWPLARLLARAPPPALERWFSRDITEYQEALQTQKRNPMISTLFEKLRGAQQQNQQTAAESFRQLAKRIASGDDPDPEKVLRILEPAGKTIEDLERTVALIARRRQLAESVKAGRLAAKQLPKLETALADNIAAAEEAEKPFIEKGATLQAQILQARATIATADTAAAELEKTATDPEIVGRVAAAHDAHSAARQRITSLLTHRAKSLEPRLTSAEVAAAKELIPTRETAAELAQVREAIRELDDEVSRLRADLPKLQAAHDNVRAELLDPLAV